ncbi:hypothetical protein [Shewanella fidelis]|uniref:TMhelix containing protein n=1 Tax=Shewanella fidelis TaxID=173509 RepID=A0AAW8NLU6_9GAMM|nr:hypothetical protein [Shewanella fidelis]MDR8523837.1 hypothetical protein [Shewanella fidelis]MDW4810385.1 hypothetical protein [Shewanella fidelis]MDW4823727.1 hypothetical protein [Shewanella fidelis]
MEKHVPEMAKLGGAGGVSLAVIVLLFNIQSGINDLNKTVADNDSRIDVIEYRLSVEK